MKEKYNTYYNPFCWTEDNRLQAVKDDKMGAFYNYDASGERNLKLTGGTVDVTQNGTSVNTPVLDQQTLYASALVTINDKGYTKHYFEEGKRICSKIGSGELQGIHILVDPLSGDIPRLLAESDNLIIKSFDECLGITPMIKTESIYDNTIKRYEGLENPDEPVFYYHSDHLGSASYITDDHGHETQHLVYLPFGELRSNREYHNTNNKCDEQHWVDMKYNTSQFDTPYKFNGKEKDDELRSNREYQNNNKLHEQTGLHYYGARYLNTDLSIWLSVDPMSDKYPHLTSYNYCVNNPVMLVDPDGREMDEYGLDVKTGRLSFIKNKEGKDVILQGTFEKDGTFKNNGGQPLSDISNDILTSTDKNEDLSKTGIIAGGGRQGEGLDIMKFISFNSNKELSAWGFNDNKGQDGLAIGSWDKNKFNSGGRTMYDESNAFKKIGTRTFHIHTHPGSKDGIGGGWKASITDHNRNFYGVRSFILSKTGLTEYGQRQGVKKTWTPNKNSLPVNLRRF